MSQATTTAPPTDPRTFVPDADAERRARALLAAYVPRIVAPDHVEAHIDELMTIEGGMADRANYFAPRMPATTRRRMLVSGCAAGSEMIVARRFGFEEVHGTEVVPELVQICETRLAGESFSVRLYDGANLPYPDSTFTAVVSGHIIEHTPSPYHYLREHLRVLAPGGWFFLEFPTRYGWRELHTGMRSVEFLPKPLRRLALRWLCSSWNGLSARERHCYRAILETLQPVSTWQIWVYLQRVRAFRARIAHVYSPAPGYVRMLIERRA